MTAMAELLPFVAASMTDYNSLVVVGERCTSLVLTLSCLSPASAFRY
jgi:hypothetical protein